MDDSETRPQAPQPVLLNKKVGSLEKKEILEMLELCGGNRLEAARRLGISRSTLWRKLHK